MKSEKRNIILILFILCHIALICMLFLFVKKEFHSDEIWSFGIANGSVSGSIYQNENGEQINYHEWTSAEVFHENLTVQPDERFRFGMTYINSKNDTHPPLSYLLIHFISSFFTNRFSFWYYIPINIIALILCDLFLYKLFHLFELSDSVSLGACALFAFCTGGINMMMFVRMYALLVAFAVVILYFSMKAYHKNELSMKDAFALIATCALGSLTEYEYYVYAFILTLLICLLMVLKKNLKLMFKYGLCMTAGVGISLLLYPDFFNDFINNTNGNGYDSSPKYPLDLQLRILVNLISKDIIGVAPSVFDPFYPILLFIGICVYVVIICVPLYFYLRKTEKGKKFLNAMKDRFKDLWNNIKRWKALLFVGFVEAVAMLCIFNSLVEVYGMQGTVVRYFYIIYPAVVVVIAILTYLLSEFVFHKWKNVMCPLLLIILCGCSIAMGDNIFLGKKAVAGSDLRAVKNANIIIICTIPAELERLEHVIDSSNYFFSVEYDKVDECMEKIKDMPQNRDVYIVLAAGAFNRKVVNENVEESNGEYFDVSNLSGNLQEKKEKFRKKWVNEGLCDDCVDIGSETMLNSKFYYYELR